MVAIRINGAPSPVTGESLPRFTDLVELLKASIDPDHMITALLIDGRELNDDEWFSSPEQFRNSVLDVVTDTPERYVIERLIQAPAIVQACYVQFRDARKTFQEGKTQAGNQKLMQGVNTLRAFFSWYATILELTPQDKRSMYDIEPYVEPILQTCQAICQQQLYQSWWALSESIEKQLEPRLDALEDFFRKLTAKMN